ncbi:hypothetical protein (nucleomorph) [Guillardia theta]|uniref:Uncharacterized protein n=1 Tax=Guillardia theta TaxID=55529 RepID=Q98RP7_GUITH|nr:hypothetical protein GTHECHR1106 [Guillardia theta]AAK39899.1 hypothetical protein [Guillardia theta]
MIKDNTSNFEKRKSEDFKEDYISSLDQKKINKIETQYYFEKVQKCTKYNIMDYDYIKINESMSNCIRLFDISTETKNCLNIYEINKINKINRVHKKTIHFNSQIVHMSVLNDYNLSTNENCLFSTIFKKKNFSIFQFFDDLEFGKIFSIKTVGKIYNALSYKSILKFDNKVVNFNPFNNNLLFFDHKNLEFNSIELKKGKIFKKKIKSKIVNFELKYSLSTEFLYHDSKKIFYDDFRQRNTPLIIDYCERMNKVQYYSDTKLLLVFEEHALKIIDIRFPSNKNIIFYKSISYDHVKYIKINISRNKIILCNSNSINIIDLSDTNNPKEKSINIKGLCFNPKVQWAYHNNRESLLFFDLNTEKKKLKFYSI